MKIAAVGNKPRQPKIQEGIDQKSCQKGQKGDKNNVEGLPGSFNDPDRTLKGPSPAMAAGKIQFQAEIKSDYKELFKKWLHLSE